MTDDTPSTDSDPADDELHQLLRSALDADDPPPPGLRDLAIRAATWDTELATLIELVHDSEATSAGLRSPDVARDLVFESDGIVVEVDLAERDGSNLLRGEVEPVPERVVVQCPGRPDRDVALDGAGRFEVSTDATQARIVVEVDGRRFRTELFDLLP